MRRITRRSLVIGAVIASTLPTEPARADLFGGDLPLLASILVEAIAQVVQIAKVVADFVQEIELIKTQLQLLDPKSLASIINFIHNAGIDYATLVSNVNSMGYTLSSVNAQFQTLFPSDMTNIPFSQFETMYGQWSKEILASSQVAARSESIISMLQADASNAETILNASQNAPGVVGQLQAVVQMLSIMRSENGSLVQTLATTGRVLGNAAASSASERQLSLEKKKRNLSNYTARGPAVQVPNKMP